MNMVTLAYYKNVLVYLPLPFILHSPSCIIAKRVNTTAQLHTFYGVGVWDCGSVCVCVWGEGGGGCSSHIISSVFPISIESPHGVSMESQCKSDLDVIMSHLCGDDH